MHDVIIIVVCVAVYVVMSAITFLLWPLYDHYTSVNKDRYVSFETYCAYTEGPEHEHLMNDRAADAVFTSLFWVWPVCVIIAVSAWRLLEPMCQAVGFVLSKAFHWLSMLSPSNLATHYPKIQNMWRNLLVKKPAPVPHDGPYR